MTPRLLLGGTGSGCGKTTVTCALLQALVSRGLRVMAAKCGPDYIDPMFHSTLVGTESGNLDLFFTPPDRLRWLLREGSAGCALTVLEGAMGYYDGIALGSRASAWELACATETPALLVLDGRGKGLSLCAELQGFLRFREDSRIQGVLLNRVSPMLYPRMKAAIEETCGVTVYGYLPAMPECAVESRHLGLVTAGEIDGLRLRLARLGEQAERSIDLDGLCRLAASASPITGEAPALPGPVTGEPVIAVARDEAFCFYYRENLRLLEQLGGKLIYFSPLHEAGFPSCDGLYLGGGYPELHLEGLGRNEGMRRAIAGAVRRGLPTVAECGGFLYLLQSLEGKDGTTAPMCGVLPGRGYPTGRLQRFGYVTLTPQKDSLLFRAGEPVPAHEFHYWDAEAPGEGLRAEKPESRRSWRCGVTSETLYAGFPHLYFYGKPELALRFLQKAAERKEARL